MGRLLQGLEFTLEFRKWVWEGRPGVDIRGGKTLIKEARVKASAYRRLGDFLSDEDDLLSAITKAWMPLGLMVGRLVFWVHPAISWHRCPPGPSRMHIADAARLTPFVGDTVVGGDPEKTF